MLSHIRHCLVISVTLVTSVIASVISVTPVHSHTLVTLVNWVKGYFATGIKGAAECLWRETVFRLS